MKRLIVFFITLGFAVPAFGGNGADEASSGAGPSPASVTTGKKVSYRKTQEVDFDAADIDGQIRSPDGAYLLQKRGVRFIPLYKVNNEFEKNILESVEYLR